jgi:hypothetical protein
VSYVRLCDQCDNKITEERTYAIKLSQKRTIHEFDMKTSDLCSWECVMRYAMAKIGNGS